MFQNLSVNNFFAWKNYLRLYRFKKNYKILHQNEEELSSFAIIPMHSIFKLKKELGNLPKPVSSISEYVAKGEWESFQVIIVPFKKGLKNIQVKIENLPFNTKYLECWQCAYVNCQKAAYKANPGWYADPLMEMTVDSSIASQPVYKSIVVPFDIPEQETRSVWFNYFVPTEIKAGDYTFKVTVSALNAESNIQESQSTEVKLKIF